MDTINEQKCPACGAPLRFDPSSGNLICDWCGSEFAIEAPGQEYVPEVSAATSEAVPTEEAPEEYGSLSVYNCRSCGAEIVAEAQTAALKCPYCGNNIVLTDKVSGNLKPDGVIPFKIEPKQLPAAVRAFYKGKHLLPRGFFSDASIGEIQGVYVPFWIYDCGVSGQLTYNAERVRVFRQGDYEITETSHFSLYRDVSMDFLNVPVDASKRMDDALMDSLEPFNMAELKPFDIKYLSGYVADRFDVDADDVRGRASERMRNTAQDVTASRTTGGFAAVRLKNNSLQVYQKGLHYYLLPVYIFDLEHNGKKYPFAVNGQTGKVVGDLPIDKLSSTLWFLGSFAAGFAATFLGALLLGV